MFMVRGLICKFNYPYVRSDISGNLMFDPMWEAVSRLERLHFYVLGITCDGATPNRRLWKLHSDSDDLTYKVPNLFADDERDFYFIPDPPRLLKTIRNSFYNAKKSLGKQNMWFHLKLKPFCILGSYTCLYSAMVNKFLGSM